MRLAVVVSYLNEERLLPVLLESIERQSRLPERLLLVDDGSDDASPDIAADFSRRNSYARALRRPRRPPEKDRLVSAAELQSFQWGLEQLGGDYDLVAKMDADLRLAPDHLEEIVRRMEADDRLGIAGAYLSVVEGERTVREKHPVEHVRGPNKFYRRECLEEISPVPAILGWDMIDEVTARMRGWRTSSFALPSGDSLHLRPTGTHDGSLRAYRRWGRCAYAYGSHPAVVAAGAGMRARRRPFVIGGASMLVGFAHAAIARVPRADPAVRRQVRREQRARLRALLGR